MRLYQIIAFCPPRTPLPQRRLWVEVGTGCTIGRELLLTPHFTRAGERQVLNLRITSPANSVNYIVPPESTLYLDRIAGLRVTPLAIEFTPRIMPARVLLEFGALHERVQFA